MSSGNRGGASASNGSIPAASKKVVQSLKEIVNYSEAEIYATLKECNMDPNEAVSRLLSQDPFHEVKSKREKKKENKDVHDSRPRGTTSTSTRSGRGGVDRYSNRGGTTQFGPDSGSSRAKPAYKKDNGPPAHTNSASAVGGNNMNKRPSPATFSDATAADKAFPTDTPENFPAALPSSGFQTAWGGMAGQVSMADIVKMGRPHGRGPSAPQQHVNNNQHSMASAARPHQSNDLHPSHNHAFSASETNLESGITESHHVPVNDEWQLYEEPPAASVTPVVEPSVDSQPADDAYDRTKQQFRSQGDEVKFAEGDSGEKTHAELVGSVPVSSRDIQEESSGAASGFDGDLYRNVDSYEEHHREVEEPSLSVSSVTANLQSMSLPKEDDDSPSEDDGPAVKIPDHLQVQSADCSHLSFGSFGSGMGAPAPFPGSFGSRPAQNNEEEAPVPADHLSAAHEEARNEYYEEEPLQTASDESTAHRVGTDSSNYDAPSVSQPTVTQEAPEVVQENQYSFPSSTADYSFENNQQLNAAFAQQQTSAQMQGLPSISGVMPYPSSLPNTLLTSNVQPREAELAYSPFPISQTMPTKYGNSASSISGPAASMAEAMKTGNFPTTQPTQTLPGSGVSGGPALPQQLVHPYSQPSVPMGHYASMLSYPFVAQSYPFLPSAFQQAFAAGNSNFPQSLAAAMLPQYKNSGSVSSLPQSGTVAPGYGAFGNSNAIPGNFPLSHPTAPAGTSMSYDDLLSSQYKDASHLLSLQQGPGSRTMSGVPGNAYYGFPGQSQQPSQQPAGYRQTQQPSQQQQQQHQHQHYGQLSGYPNYYHSQGGPTIEQQLQMTRDGSLGGSQGQQQKQNPQQLWQNGY